MYYENKSMILFAFALLHLPYTVLTLCGKFASINRLLVINILTHMAQRGSKFGMGLVIGTVIGGLAAFFLSPRSGKENQEMVKKKLADMQKFIEEKEIDKEAKKIFGDVSEKTKKLSQQLQQETKTRWADLQDAAQNFDIEQYTKQVTKITDQLKKEGGAEELMEKARNYLMSFFQEGGSEKKTTKTEKKDDDKKTKKS